MASQALGRPGVMLPPSLPTIKETTLSWLGSELESSLFSTNGRVADNEPTTLTAANVQRYIDFDEQCLSLKSGEGSDFSGIQPLPAGSDDTPPTAVNEFNRVMRMDFHSLLADSQNRPKPSIESDHEPETFDEETEVSDVPPNARQEIEEENHLPSDMKPITPSDFQALIGMVDGEAMHGEIGSILGSGDNPTMERLQLVRLWQMMQEEELRRRQEAEIAILSAQREKMMIDRNGNQNLGLKKVDHDPGIEFQDLDDLESGDLESYQEEDQYPMEDETHSHPAQFSKNLDISQEPFDEIPVEKEKKSFEQLLEEELRKEEDNHHKNPKQDQPKGPVKRPFLKRGQGLARFKGPPVRKPPKTRQENNPKPQNKILKAENPPKVSAKLPSRQDATQMRNLVTKKPPVANSVRPKTQKMTGSQNQKVVQKPRKPITKLELKPETAQENTRVSSTLDEDPGVFMPAEDADLEEFEMLERYAEDDSSFFNEPSLIVSVLQQERDVHGAPKEENRLSLRERVRERRRLREEARAKIQDAPKIRYRLRVGNQDSQNVADVEPLADDLEKTLKEDEHSGQEEEEILSPMPPKPYFRSPEKPKSKVIQRKTASLVRKEKLLRPIAQNAPFSPTQSFAPNFANNPAFSDLQSSPNSAFSPHQHPVLVQGEGSSQEEDDNPGHDFQDDQTWGDIDVSVLNTSLHPVIQDPGREEQDPQDSGRKYKCSDYMEPEREEVENPVRDTDVLNPTSARELSLSPPPPPTSLMQKLFPGLKVPKSSSSNSKDSQNHSEDTAQDVQAASSPVDSGTSQESQASLLKQKLQELESEIGKFKKENLALETRREKQDEDARKFSKEVGEFRKQNDEELARFEEYKKTEMKKLKREKKLFEEHVLATKMMPRKEEREEIQKLQAELEDLRAENKSKEQKWISANNRMRGQVERLEKENQELKERIQEIETQRLKEWNAQKTNRPKQQSVWKTVNKIVESAVIDTENENLKISPHSTAKTPLSDTSNITNGTKKQKSSEKLPKRSNDVKKYPLPTSLSPNIAYSNLKDTIERTKPVAPPTPETVHKDGKVEKMLKDGSRIVVFPNGTQKEISADGKMVKVRFANGDIKQIYSDGSIVYYYEENGTTHTTHADGLQVFEFPNKQVEHHFPDGTKQITFPDQTVKYLHTDGTEQTVFPDGTEMHVATNKEKTIIFANGQREIHTGNFKRREYPDGTSKTVFEDGRQETRYASGRLRVKDAHGNVIVDRMAT